MSDKDPTPPGWYPDPQAPDTVRWWDGTGWTEHAGPATPAAGATGTSMLPGAPGPYGTATPTPKRRGWVLPVVLVSVAAVVLLAIGGVALVRWLSNRAAVELVDAAPATLLGHAHSDDEQMQLVAQQVQSQLAASSEPLGARTVAAAYGTTADAPILAGWVATSSLLPPSTTAQLRDGMVAGSGLQVDPARQQSGPGPHGGALDCIGGTIAGLENLPIDACTWVRDGTGVVYVIQYGRAAGESFAEMPAAVEELLVGN